MDSETRRAVQALCRKLGHEWKETTIYKVTEVRCKICDMSKAIFDMGSYDR